MAIWHDLVDMHGFNARYSSVRRFVQTLRQTAPELNAVITTAPGEESQLDYGDGPMLLHPVSGKYRRTRLFGLTLGCSRKSVRLLVWQSSAQIWAELHERAFRRLGGTTRVVVLDNLRYASSRQTSTPRRSIRSIVTSSLTTVWWRSHVGSANRSRLRERQEYVLRGRPFDSIRMNARYDDDDPVMHDALTCRRPCRRDRTA